MQEYHPAHNENQDTKYRRDVMAAGEMRGGDTEQTQEMLAERQHWDSQENRDPELLFKDVGIMMGVR